MSPSEKCQNCGAAIPEAGGARGLCPCCLLELGLKAEPPPPEAQPTPARAAAESESWLTGRIGPYKCLTVLGTGGMGVVVLAEQAEPIRRRVAIKVVKRGMDSKEVLARFESERQALALMSHPGIAKVLDAGTTEQGRPYFVMEYVPGLPITEYCDRNHLSAKERVALLIQVCEAIQHAHTKGIVHRDVKPTNVLVCDEVGRPQPKIIDFGVAKALNQRLTERTLFTSLGVMIGTPGYASPEQSDATGLDVDTRSDIYSLGVLAYELLVGSPPFDPKRLREAGWAEMQRIIREEEPPRPSARLTTQGLAATDVAKRRRTDPAALASQLKGDLDWITLKALEKDRARRYQSASELAADLQRHLNDEPVSAGPPDLGYRLRKAVRRHRLVFAAAASGLAAILAGLVVSTAFYLRAEHTRRERQREVVRLNVATGMRLADEGDRMAALPWLVEALRLEDDDRRREIHRKRIAATLAHLPVLYRLWQHRAPVSKAVWRPDGAAVATAARDGAVQIWIVATGEATTPPLRHQGPIHDLQFSPDGGRVVTAGDDGMARVWDAATGREMLVLKHAGPVRRAVFSPDGRLVATASDDQTAVVWDATDGTPLSTVRHDWRVDWAEFSPSGDAVLTTSRLKALVSDARTGRPRLGPLEHDHRVHRAAFTGDGSKLATMTWSGLRLWNARTGQPLTPLLRHESPIFNGALSRSGRWLLGLAEGDPELPVWNAQTGARAHVSPKGGAASTSAMFSDDERLILAGDADGRVHIWWRDTGEPATSALRHGGSASVAGLDPSGRLLLTYSADGTARVWDLAPAAGTSDLIVRHEVPALWAGFFPDPVKMLTVAGWALLPDSYARAWNTGSGDPITPPLRHASIVTSHSMSGDGLVGTTSFDGTARVWDLGTGEPIMPPLRHAKQLWHGRLTRDRKRLIAVAGPWKDFEVHVWDVATGASLSLPITQESHLVAVAYSPDDQYMVTVGADGHMRVWDTYSGTSRSARLKHQGSGTGSTAVSPDGRVLLGFEESGSLQLWDAPAGRLVAALRGARDPIASRFSPSGELLAVGSYGGDLRVWNGRTGEPMGSPMRHRGAVGDVRFSPERRLLASTSSDRTARVWDAETGEPVTHSLAHGNEVREVEFAPDGGRIATASLDGTARVWTIEHDQRPIEDLVALAQLLAGRRIVGTTGSLELTADELWQSWQRLRRLYPTSFEASPGEIHGWHRAQAEDLSHDERWREAIGHFDAALAHGPKRWMLLVGRGRAHAELRDWENAARDFAEALQMIPGELEPAHAVAILHLLRGQPELLERTRESLVSRWAHTRNPDRARWAAEAMVIAPIASEGSRLQAMNWAETALEIEPKRRERLALHGAALFRAGRIREAAKALEAAVAKGAGGQGGNPRASAFAFLALTTGALGRPAEAARWRAAAVARLRELEHPASASGPRTASPFVSSKTAAWWEREELGALLRESLSAGSDGPP